MITYLSINYPSNPISNMSNCAICFEELNISDGNFLKLKCKHEFHFSCIFQLMATNSNYNDKCPYCRDELIGGKIKVIIKSNQERTLIDLIHHLTNQISDLQEFTGKLSIFLGFTLGLTIVYSALFFYLNPQCLWGFFDLIYYILFTIGFYIGYFIQSFIYSIYNTSIWFWLKIGNYILSFLILGIFVILQSNGNIPLLVR